MTAEGAEVTGRWTELHKDEINNFYAGSGAYPASFPKLTWGSHPLPITSTMRHRHRDKFTLTLRISLALSNQTIRLERHVARI